MSNSFLEDMREKEEQAFDEAEEYFDRIGADFEEPWRIRFTGIIGDFEARYQYHSNSVVFNDAETLDEEFSSAFIHENMHQRHATKAFGEVSDEFEQQLDAAEKAQRGMSEEALEKGLRPVYIEALGDRNFLPRQNLDAAAKYHNGDSVDKILEEYGVSELGEVDDEEVIDETFPKLTGRSEEFNDGAWMAASEVVANLVDYHHSGLIEDLPRDVMVQEVTSSVDRNNSFDFDYSNEELTNYTETQMNFLTSLYEKVSETGSEDKLIGRIVSATDRMFEDYDSWNGLPSVKNYVMDDLNLS